MRNLPSQESGLNQLGYENGTSRGRSKWSLSRKQTDEVQAVLNGFYTVAEDYFSFDPSLETY